MHLQGFSQQGSETVEKDTKMKSKQVINFLYNPLLTATMSSQDTHKSTFQFLRFDNTGRCKCNKGQIEGSSFHF